MGQYYRIVNLDKNQYIKPHDFGDGAKLMEFGLSGEGVMAALAVLLADGNGRGGGDIRSDSPLVGSWAGDRIVITGDYADAGRFVPADAGEGVNLYSYTGEHCENISERVRAVFVDADETIGAPL